VVLACPELEVNNSLYEVLRQQVEVAIDRLLVASLHTLTIFKITEQIILNTFFQDVGFVQVGECGHLGLHDVNAFVLILADYHPKVSHVGQGRNHDEKLF